MNTVELVNESIEVKFEDKTFNVDLPTPADLKLLPKDDDITKYDKFFAALGLDEVTFKKLQVKQIKLLLEALLSKKD